MLSGFGHFNPFSTNKVITGTVTSAVEGEGAIPGVTVQVKGTTLVPLLNMTEILNYLT